MTLSISPPETGHAAAPARRDGVPWATVLVLAVVMTYADGFWIQSMRGATGAIERTQTPFSSWLRASTVLLPLFAFAVLGALTVAHRRFGPVLYRRRTLFATGLMVVVAGTLAGVASLAASSAYDFHLQALQLDMRGSMGSSCVGACLTHQRDATLGLQLHAVEAGALLLLVTNLVVVGWATALRGGRLDVASTRRPVRMGELRLLLVVALAGSGAVHAAVVPEHLAEWRAAGVFFILLAAAQVVLAGLLVVRGEHAATLAAAVVSGGALLLWAWSRTAGLPFGPEAGVAERVGLADVASGVLELAAVAAAVVLVRGSRRATAAPVHLNRLAVVALLAVTAVGLAGTGIAAFDAFDIPAETAMGSAVVH